MHLSDITGSFSLYIDIDFIIGTQFTDEIHNEKTSIFSECGTPQNRGRHTRPHHTRRNDTTYPCMQAASMMCACRHGRHVAHDPSWFLLALA